jgi:hypothetical protein
MEEFAGDGWFPKPLSRKLKRYNWDGKLRRMII